MNIRMDVMRDLAHYFGRTAFQKEVADQYEVIINGWSQGLFENVIQYVREGEHITDFPKPFEMDRIGRNYIAEHITNMKIANIVRKQGLYQGKNTHPIVMIRCMFLIIPVSVPLELP